MTFRTFLLLSFGLFDPDQCKVRVQFVFILAYYKYLWVYPAHYASVVAGRDGGSQVILSLSHILKLHLHTIKLAISTLATSEPSK